MKFLILILISGFISAQKVEIRRVAIYGDDDRKNYYEADNISKALSGFVGMLVRNVDLLDLGNSKYLLKTTKLSDRFNILTDERFASEPVVGFCSGFLASSTTFITAAHCIEKVSCRNFSVVFDWRIEREGVYPSEIDSNNVYRCSTVVYNGRSRGYDFAVIRLDRLVRDRYPLALERKELEVGRSVFVIGYPNGLPLKITSPNTSRIRTVSSTTYVCDLDTFRGNSGSPVFDENSLKVIGILIEGEDDYIYSDGKNEVRDPSFPHLYESGRYNVLPQDGGKGEIVLKSILFEHFVPANDLERFINSNPGFLRRTNNQTQPAIYNPTERPIQVRPAIYEVPDIPKDPKVIFI
ncbi:MAG: serine protease [Candidatus Anstonellales archaeon]